MNSDWLDLFSSKYFDLHVVAQVFPLILKGVWVSIAVTFTGWLLAALVGFPLLLLRRSRFVPLSWAAGGFIEFVRSTPILVQIYFYFYVLPNTGIVLDPISTGILALTIHYGCYMSEAYRSGLEAIHHGQWDAVTALGFSKLHVYRYVILPQMVPPLIPALGNFLILMIKDSPLLASIGVVEMMYYATGYSMDTFRYLEPTTIVGLIFLMLSLASAAAIRFVEARVGRKWLGRAGLRD